MRYGVLHTFIVNTQSSAQEQDRSGASLSAVAQQSDGRVHHTRLDLSCSNKVQ